MDRTTLEQQLQLLLSWRAKVLQCQAEEVDAVAQGKIDAEQLEFDRTTHETHLEAVESDVAELRAEVQRLSAQHAEVLQARLRAQETLIADAAAGKLSPMAANRQNHKLIQELAAIREELHALNHLQRAKTPEELGGFLDFPLEQYAPKAARLAGRASSAKPAALVHVERTPAAARPAPASTGAGRQFWNENRVTLVAAPILLLLGVFAVLYLRVWRHDVRFEVYPPAEGAAMLGIRCHNQTLQPVTWHVPWHTGRLVRPRGDFGLDLYLRETGAPEYRHFLAPPEIWLHEGQTMEGLDLLSIPPRLHTDVQLDLAALRSLAPEMDGLHIAASRGDGRIYLRHELALP